MMLAADLVVICHCQYAVFSRPPLGRTHDGMNECLPAHTRNCRCVLLASSTSRQGHIAGQLVQTVVMHTLCIPHLHVFDEAN